MAKKQFKAESKRLLDLMINSIYTHKEIFLRELISNASDAIDKLYYKSLTENISGLSREQFSITIEPDEENRTLKISDNGLGMTKEELEKNLGTIAKSGSLDFKTDEDKERLDEIDIIGQFGVGFYSAFMVSDKVTVISKAYGEECAYQWESTGADGYVITEAEKDDNGTEIILHIKQDTEDEKYSDYLQSFRLRMLIKKYSDYVRYPIQMMVEHQRPVEGKDGEYETYSELETLNSMVPMWKKNKNELTDEDYNNFYKEKFFDFQDPAKVIHTNAEGVVSYTSLLYVPGQRPYDYYSNDYEKGLQLYSSGVLIMDKCADLLPDYFSFVKGLVDSQDLSLNISREMLQHDRQLKAIAQRIEKKIKSELENMVKNDRDKYLDFYRNFGMQLKYGMYDNYGMNKDVLKDLVLFHSSSEKTLTTFAEYVSRMKEDQEYIYYACGKSVDAIDRLPKTELIKEEGYEILYLTDDIDEFALQVLHEYDGKEFKSVSAEYLGLPKEDEETAEKQTEENKELLEYMNEVLGDKVSEVKISPRLKSYPVCLTAKGGLSIEMEKVLNSMPVDEKVQAERVLEINANHGILEALTKAFAFDDDKATVEKYTQLLYNQALLIEGLQVEDPVAFSNAICDLMTK